MPLGRLLLATRDMSQPYHQLGIVLLVVGACQRSAPSEAQPSNAQTAVAPSSAAPPPVSAPSSTPARHVFSFDADAEGAPPRDFAFGRTGGGRLGRWAAQRDDAAKSVPNVLVQLDADPTSFRFPVAVTLRQQPADVRASVSCKMLAGAVDRACGLVLRYRDENNYLVTRANALENNVRLYTVLDGRRKELASHDRQVTPNVWHELRFEAQGATLKVSWDGVLAIEHRDETFLGAGSVGVWTKADSVTHYDDLAVEAL